MNHTPTPWKVKCDGTIDSEPASFSVLSDDGGTIALVNTIGSNDAEHIVRCVNSYDALIAALTKISDIPCDHGGQDECPREIARAALAKEKAK